MADELRDIVTMLPLLSKKNNNFMSKYYYNRRSGEVYASKST